MSEQNPYEKLGVSEEASFDEIQDIRNRLLEQHSDDSKHVEMIEAAYDAILMERLRMRQEGKIKVPERIRFPERLIPVLPKEKNPILREKSPAWLQNFLDQPSRNDILWPAALYLGLSIFSLFNGDAVLQLILVAGVAISVYFLNRKGSKVGKAILLTLGGLVFGLLLGAFIAVPILSQFIDLSSLTIAQLSTLRNQFSAILTFIFLWLISSFLK
ncbi:CPP1-like family protein [Mastigocoleus sp. MO_188.B34]|uniref:CPP1-like family protein n=1 Tax=Mastigocoleus sp. MO_188.B34 TaxID=3036635 RepID=UPI00260D6BBC|nr:CPP1-like family protein [Mastigocoleus sp. MO_188.B34]MDJ0696237.1 CPP1-like family protein [Mastigocoleus sp. MO_188.B34]